MQPGGKVIYIAGPIAGVKKYKKRFKRAVKKLSKKGWDPYSPADMGGEGLRQIMAEELHYIALCCDAIYMLRGWENSKGAQCEWALARALDLQIIYQKPKRCCKSEKPR